MKNKNYWAYVKYQYKQKSGRIIAYLFESFT